MNRTLFLLLSVVACGGPPSVPYWRIEVEVSIECAAGATCAPLRHDNPMFDTAKRADSYDCVPQQADGVVLYEAAEPIEQFQFVHDPDGFAVESYEARPDAAPLYRLDSAGRVLSPSEGVTVTGNDQVEARYASGDRVVVERHRIVPNGSVTCYQRGEPMPAGRANGWGW